MRKERIAIIITAAILALLAIAYIGFTLAGPAKDTGEQTTTGAPLAPEQNIDKPEDIAVKEVDINNTEFTLTGSNIACTTTDNVSTCTGTISIVKDADSSDRALYKINDQTKLLHDGAALDIQTLQQLAQAQTKIRVTLATDSSDTLSEIKY